MGKKENRDWPEDQNLEVKLQILEIKLQNLEIKSGRSPRVGMAGDS